MNGTKGVYSPAEFARKANVSYSTLRRWDKEGRLVPRRNAVNRRVYTDADYEHLQEMRGEEPTAGERLQNLTDNRESYPLLVRRLFQEYLSVVRTALSEGDCDLSVTEIVNGAVNYLSDGVHRGNCQVPDGMGYDVPVRLIPEEAAELFCVIYCVDFDGEDLFSVLDRDGEFRRMMDGSKESVFSCQYLRDCGISLTLNHIERFLRMVWFLVKSRKPSGEGGDPDGVS